MNKRSYDWGTEGSAIRELYAYGRSRAAVIGDENVYDFTQGNPSNPTPPEVKAAVLELLEQDTLTLHGYTHAIGDLAARSAIAEDLNARYGANCSGEDLFLTCGAAPALCAVFHALADENSEILTVAPYFPEYKPYAELTGAAFKVVPPDVPDFQIRLDMVEKFITEKTAVLLLNSPNNPSGTVYTEETLTALADILRKKEKQYGHPIYIVSDEPYRELVYDGITVPFLPKIYENTVVCYSYSKTLTLPGERMGYIYVPKTVENSRDVYAAVCGAARALGHICAPALWQKVIAKCAHLRPDMTAYDKNRRMLCDGLRAAGYEVATPGGAFYLFVKAPGGDANAFAEKAKLRDLIVVPGDSFGCPGYLRLCYCGSPEKIEKSLPIFRELMTEY